MSHEEAKEEIERITNSTEKELKILEQGILSFTNEEIKEIWEYDEDMEVIEKDKSRKKISVQDMRNRIQKRKKDLQLQRKSL